MMALQKGNWKFPSVSEFYFLKVSDNSSAKPPGFIVSLADSLITQVPKKKERAGPQKRELMPSRIKARTIRL